MRYCSRDEFFKAEWKPQRPWMIDSEIDAISELVLGARVFEYGSGGSTIHFGALAKEYYSLETDEIYYGITKDTLRHFAVRVYDKETREDQVKTLGHVKIFHETDHKKYLEKINEIGGKFDVILVDNNEVPRKKCALHSFDYINDDGILLVHDSIVEDGGVDPPSAAVTMTASGNERLGITSGLKEEFHPLLKKYTLYKTTQSLSLFKKKN